MSKKAKRRVTPRFIFSATACLVGLALLLIFREQYVTFRDTVRGDIISIADSIGNNISSSFGGLTLLDGIRLGKNYAPMTGEGEEVSQSEVSSAPENAGGEYDFPADFYPYRAMLDENAQSVYNQVYANALKLNSHRFTLTYALTEDDLHDVMSAVYNDHPELFWLDTSYSFGYLPSGKIVTVALSYNASAADIAGSAAAFDSAVQSAVSAASQKGSDVEKEIFVHDYLLGAVEYDQNAPMNQSAYSALVGGQSVCAGYSRAFQLIMQKLGIPCYYSTGTADGGDHAWNIIRLSGEHYNIDVSWDDALTNAYSTNTYTYFNVPDDTFSTDHSRDALSGRLPACQGTALTGTVLFSGGTEEAAKPAATAESGKSTKGRTYKNLGFEKSEILTSMDEYNQYCKDTLIKLGTGGHTFQMVLKNAALLSDIYSAARNDQYLSGYIEGVVAALGLRGCSVQLELKAETLAEGYILLTQNITLTEKAPATPTATPAPTASPLPEAVLTPEPAETRAPQVSTPEPTPPQQAGNKNSEPAQEGQPTPDTNAAGSQPISESPLAEG